MRPSKQFSIWTQQTNKRNVLTVSEVNNYRAQGFKHKTCDKSFLPRDIENVTKANMRLNLLLMVSCVLLVFSMVLGEFSDEPIIYSVEFGYFM